MMKRKLLFAISALAFICLASCNKPGTDDPKPVDQDPIVDPVDPPVTPDDPVDPVDPAGTITITPSNPGGFSDGGFSDWNE